MRPVPVRIWDHNGVMESPSSRALRLLSLLQSGRAWRAADLAHHLEIGNRTLRRDVSRLRSLGYEILAAPGPGGGYTLVPGVKIPPLLLDADEVSSIVTGLLVLEAGSIDPAAMAVRTKLEQLLPPRLRRRAAAVAFATQVIGVPTPAPDWEIVGVLADAVAEGHQVRFTYTDASGCTSDRHVVPYRHVLRRGTWYLIAYDTDRAAWRLFRLDRVQNAVPHTLPTRLVVPDFPDTSIENWLATDFGRASRDNR